MSAVADKLDEARALIECGWTQEAYARGKSGRNVDLDGRSAVCFCAVGAIKRIEYWHTAEVAAPLLSVLGCRAIVDIYGWNDDPERTQAEVIDAFKRAAELARAGEQ